MVAFFFKKNKSINQFKNRSKLFDGFKMKHVRAIEAHVNSLNSEQLFDLGYYALHVSTLILRKITLCIHANIDFQFWANRIANATHNIPSKLQQKNMIYLREDIIKTLTVIYNLQEQTYLKGLDMNPMLDFKEYLKASNDFLPKEYVRS
ncbi:hypothetical protein [Priestia aryabhattai]|uniref:hypothetical protein n=1 Tax=Priestia aryabhattai TaxID=412384 RepID=UPI001C8F0B9A|nr:hypothetical protein [Priestia aryabhattai]MBX9998166.1 hypothetical protein [Priestia aryabhattai]